jgi:hypothetical protein
MAIDPQKLAAVAGDKGGPPRGKPDKNSGPQPKGGNPHDAHPDMAESDETESDEASELPEELQQYAEFLQSLEAHAEDLEDQCDGLDGEFISDPGATPDDEQKQELEECLEACPDDLVSSFKAHGANISHDDALKLAEHLESEGMISDAEPVAGFIFHVGQVIDGFEPAGGGGSEGGEEPHEDGEDEEELDELAP